ncbi:MAG: hypothetical protein IJ785_03915 [Bacteroidales bacterium]|nr:hypothetical protein [Bacteroidales bacterium]
MKDIDQLIEQIHQTGRRRLESGCTPDERPVPLLGWGSRPLWRYAAAVAAVIMAGVLLLPLRQEPRMPEVAHADVPQSVWQQLEEVRHTAAPQLVASRTDYAYSETSDGVRVYCDNNCNADEVLDRMKHIIETLQ